VKGLAIAVAACIALASCGGGEKVAAGSASQDLTERVAAIRAAVEDGDAALAELLLDGLQGAVGDSVAAGLLSEEQATAIHSAAEGVVAELDRLPVGVTPAQSPSPTPTVNPGDEHDEDHDNSGPGNGDEEDDDNSGPGNGDD
jgi:hypothetical protein